MSATAEFIARLAALGPGDLARLRRLAGAPLHEALDGFDLFTGLWWPLRQHNPHVPRREAAWIAAKLFAWHPAGGGAGSLGAALGKLARSGTVAEAAARLLDLLVAAPAPPEPLLRRVLRLLARRDIALDWVQFVDDLAHWGTPPRLPQESWTADFFQTAKGA